MRRLTFGAGAVGVALASNDPAAAAWVGEFLGPWFVEAAATPEWRVSLWSSRDRWDAARAEIPAEASPHACFALDTYALSLPAWRTGTRTVLLDAERSCVLDVTPFSVDVLGDPGTRRWRFTVVMVVLEIAATRMRRMGLDLHAAAVEARGRSLLIVGPKGAGKTTLSLHLLRGGTWHAMSNDRAFAVAADGGFVVYGVPTAAKIRPATLAQFPELGRGLPAVERPYLYGREELSGQPVAGDRDPSTELALSPPQLLRQLGANACASAPLGAIVFPELRADVAGSAVVPLDPHAVRTAIWANLYGIAGRREPTVFEEIDGGMRSPSPDVAVALARSVPGYRVLLGPRAYASDELAAELLEIVTGT
jgi:hypothetical protein